MWGTNTRRTNPPKPPEQNKNRNRKNKLKETKRDSNFSSKELTNCSIYQQENLTKNWCATHKDRKTKKTVESAIK